MATDGWLQCNTTQASPTVAVAVLPKNQDHTGIVYFDEAGQHRFLHLAFHALLQHDDVTDDVMWVSPTSTLHPTRQEHVAAMCERVWARHQTRGLPYGFRYDASRFRRDGTVNIGPNERGFTCATFVLAVFRSVGVELLNLGEWPAREDDHARFERLLDLLRRHCDDEIHIKAVSAETKAIRYRALEVAGGSRHTPPASFSDASSGAAKILDELHERDSVA